MGAEVELVGLKNRPDLNGAYARITSFDTSSGRYVVKTATAQEMALKPTNLQLRVARASSSGVGVDSKSPLYNIETNFISPLDRRASNSPLP